MKKRFLTWDHIDLLVGEICCEIRASRKSYQAICGISRGGLVPAVMFSHQLGIPMVPIAARSVALEAFKDEPILVVDEIYDTGETLNWFLARYPVIDTAVLVCRPPMAPVTFKGSEIIEKDEWIVFPWENRDEKI